MSIAPGLIVLRRSTTSSMETWREKDLDNDLAILLHTLVEGRRSPLKIREMWEMEQPVSRATCDRLISAKLSCGLSCIGASVVTKWSLHSLFQGIMAIVILSIWPRSSPWRSGERSASSRILTAGQRECTLVEWFANIHG